MIDGTANTDTALGTPAVILSVDALEEFKEQTKTYSAEYGFSANQINLVSKSGTNEYHGSLFYFGRNDSLDAKNFFDSPTSRQARAGPEAVRRDDQRSDHQEQDLPARSTTRARGSTGGRAPSTSCRPRTSWRAASRRRSSIPSPASPFRTTRSPRRASRASPSWRSGTTGTPPRTSNAPQGNYQSVRTLPQTQNQFTVRLDQDLGRFGRAFGRFTKTTYDNQYHGPVTRDRRPVSTSRTPRTGRSPTPGRSRATSSTCSGSVASRPSRTSFPRRVPGGHRLPRA